MLGSSTGSGYISVINVHWYLRHVRIRHPTLIRLRQLHPRAREKRRRLTILKVTSRMISTWWMKRMKRMIVGDTHPTPLCMQTRLISHFTNSSDISTYQILYRRQIRTCPNDPIVFPSRLRTGECIADSAQLRFHLLSPSI